MKIRNIIAIGINSGLLIGCNGGNNSHNTSQQNGLSFTKIGAPFISLGEKEYTISAKGGVVSLIVAPQIVVESAITIYNINETSTQDNATKKQVILPESYIFQGGVVVSDETDKMYITVLDPNNKYNVLSFNSTNGTFKNLGTYVTKWNMMQSYGYEWHKQFYMISDDGSGENGNLCWSSVEQENQTANCTNNGVLPTWYTGRYIVDNQDVYYGTTSGLFASSLSGIIRQIGQNADELISQNHILEFSLPQIYKDNIYFIGVDTINERPILCHIGKNASPTDNWKCSVEVSNILDGDIYLTDFYIDRITGVAVISTVDKNNNVQLYKTKL